MAKHILVIEGAALAGDAVARLLASEGYQVHVASDSDRALAMSQQLPELAWVITDAAPDPAAELVTRIRKAHPLARPLYLGAREGTGDGLAAFTIEDMLSTIQRLSADLDVERNRSRLLDNLRKNVVTMVDSLARALEDRDPYTAGHSARVSAFSVVIGKGLGLSEFDLEVLRHGAVLHDIGKIAVRQDVLHKPGRLTQEEYEHIKSHPVVGREILEPIEDFKPMLDIVYYHHERIDGKGYPEGLAGDRIPLFAQIGAVADTYDAMTSDRPYRLGMHPERALAIMAQIAGTQLNAEFVDILSRHVRARLAAGIDIASI